MWLMTKINYNKIKLMNYQSTNISIKENILFLLIIWFLIGCGFYPYCLILFTEDLTILHNFIRLTF
jgi:NADH:ubiquinone oxidoreductase subunit 4 (subunit M)